MLKKAIFRDYQEQQAADHTDLQTFAEQTFDTIVADAVTSSRRYAGFAVTKTAQAEVNVASGRFYDAGGAIYRRTEPVVQSMLPYLAAASKRIVIVSANGVVNNAEVEERDFLVNVQTGQTEPQAVATQSSRDAVLTFTQGAESADPQAPAIPATHVAIARVLLDTLQVVSITMLTDNQVASTEELDQRTDGLEAFRRTIEPRVSSLGSDLASLANSMRSKGHAHAIAQIYEDLARVKARLEIPDAAADYGADRFLDADESDTANVSALGYDARVEEGVRFSDANADVDEIGVFAANDPNAALSNGLLLPAYDHAVKMAIGPYHSDLGIAQFGFQTHELTQLTMSRQRLRYGSMHTVCSNGSWWQSGSYDSATNVFTKDGETFEVLDVNMEWYNWSHVIYRLRQVWTDTYQEPYWAYVPIEHSITGAQVAQTFLVTNDMWLTRVGFYLTAKAANEAVYIDVCEVTNGVPDKSRVILHQMVDHAALVINEFTRVVVPPTFLKSGKRYGLVLTSNANHRIGLASGQQYLDGTFFYSTDSAYYQGDLTKDMMLELSGARFRSPQVTIELDALNLDGGIRYLDLLADTIVPASTNLVYEIQPGGAGEWIPLAADIINGLAAAPPLCRFRARFVGTRDVQPGIKLGGSQMKIARPKTTFKHVSSVQTLAASSDDIYVKVLLEGFYETPHNLNCTLRVGAVNETPDVTADVVVPDLPNIDGRLERTFRFQLAAPITTFRIVLDGVTTSAGNTFHVSERVHWAL